MLPTADADKFAIRELVENWALWRDAGDWARFATVWHPTEGWMTATWFQGPARDFIAVSRQGFEAGVSILHFLGGHTADVAGDRAIAQTKMTISQRAEVDGVAVDVVCTGRFYDFCARHEGQWKIVRRRPSTRRTASTSWTRRAPSPSILRCLPGSRSATGTWATSRPDRVHGEDRFAGADRRGRPAALRRGRRLAGRLANAGGTALTRTGTGKQRE